MHHRYRMFAVLGVALCTTAVVALAVAGGGDTGRENSDTGAPGAAAASAAPTGEPALVLVPGRPGESASLVPADELTAPDGSAHNLFDTTFVQMMIPHHVQALEMAGLAPGRAANPQILAIADRIRAAQLPEVVLMRGWLAARRLPADPAGHDHATMAGMQSPEAVRALAAATGADFDRMFVRMMSDHHRGAVTMAVEVLKVCRNLQVQELANGIASEQAVEIDRMDDALSG